MFRTTRYRYVPPVTAHSAGFETQLYEGLRKSPWWVISIAVHVGLFLVASMLAPREPRDAPPTQITIEHVAAYDDAATPPEDPTDPARDPTVFPDPTLVPRIEKLPESDVPRIDQDLPYDDVPLGDEGLADGDFSGPGTNSHIGLGRDAGGLFGSGRGTPRDGAGGGGGGVTDRAVEDALRWLQAHQSPNGSWEAARFHRWCDGRPIEDGPDGLGQTQHDAGVTGLALLAFLGAGYTQRGDHPFATTVGRGLRFLKNCQDAEGFFGSRACPHAIYSHATAALAMVEAYGMTESPVLRRSAQKSLDMIARARNPYYAWRYGVRPGDNDTSVTGWMMMALKSASLVNAVARERGLDAPLQIDEEAFDGIRTWLDRVTDPDSGRVGYLERGSAPARPQHLIDQFPGDRSESMTSVGVLARVFAGEDPNRSQPIQRGAALCAARLPTWDTTTGDIDMYYWYYGTLALYQVGGRPWKAWNDAMRTAIVDHQRRDTDFCRYRGSWDPVGPWGGDGGRVYATALMAMCLEVYYRYDRVFGTDR